MFGKLMSISDDLMGRYYDLLLHRQSPSGMHPLEAKKQLASEIVKAYHSADAARKTLDEWNIRFTKRELEHADLPAFSPTEQGEVNAVSLLSLVYREVFNLNKSHSEISRLIKQGSFEVDGTKVHEPKAKITLRSGQVLRLDRKHAVRIR
jgi:tyrosyl-tRNA synthetase